MYKKKRNSNDTRNYRGNTVPPVICKVIEVILRDRLSQFVNQSQNPLQRGFTKGSSPLNCALIIEECVRDVKDRNETIYMAMLDAKSAFDVVPHSHLIRELYKIGVYKIGRPLDIDW